MSFSDFKTLEDVTRLHPLHLKESAFLPNIRLELPAWFIAGLSFALSRKPPQESEMFLREAFIYPFLQRVWERHPRLQLWVNQPLNYDQVLCGEPDYFVAAAQEEMAGKFVQAPFLAVAEAKRQDFDQGWAQCAAEMIACRELNAGSELTVYGIVSTGLVWEFGKLQGKFLTRDPAPGTVRDPHSLFGMLDYVFAECERQLDAPPAAPLALS